MRTFTVVGGAMLLVLLAQGASAQAPPAQGPPSTPPAGERGRGPQRPPLLPTPPLTARPTPDADGNFVIGPPYTPAPELTVKDGAIQQSNFSDYPVLRMSDLPEIHTRIVTTNNPPTGMGEIGVVAVAPAIATALFQLTGKRIRALPMSPERVKTALG